MVKQQALPIDLGSAQYHELAGKIARAMVQAYTVPISRLEGDYSAQRWDDLSDLIADVPRQNHGHPRTAASGEPLLSEMFEKWLRAKAGNWSPPAAADYRIGPDLFKEVAGDLPVGDISSDAPRDHSPARGRPRDMFMNFPTEMRWATMTRSTPR